MSEDPYLVGVIAAQQVKGIQSRGLRIFTTLNPLLDLDLEVAADLVVQFALIRRVGRTHGVSSYSSLGVG